MLQFKLFSRFSILAVQEVCDKNALEKVCAPLYYVVSVLLAVDRQ